MRHWQSVGLSCIICFMKDKTQIKGYDVYILRCSDDTLYCGYAADVEARVRVHNLGQGAKYTRSRLPVQPVYVEHVETKSEAMQRERAIKRLTRAQKLQLIHHPQGGLS